MRLLARKGYIQLSGIQLVSTTSSAKNDVFGEVVVRSVLDDRQGYNTFVLFMPTTSGADNHDDDDEGMPPNRFCKKHESGNDAVTKTEVVGSLCILYFDDAETG